MFAVTRRLLLRPGWIEDAAVLAKTIADERIVRNLARAPWPYSLGDAQRFLKTPRDPRYPCFLIFDRTANPVQLIGAIGFDDESGAPELSYWIASDRWNRGFATEAVRAAIDNARISLGYRRIAAGHFIDNLAAGRVLEKLDFRKTGRSMRRHRLEQGYEADWVAFELKCGNGLAHDAAMAPALAA